MSLTVTEIHMYSNSNFFYAIGKCEKLIYLKANAMKVNECIFYVVFSDVPGLVTQYPVAKCTNLEYLDISDAGFKIGNDCAVCYLCFLYAHY